MQVQLINRKYTTANYPSGTNTWLLANTGQLVAEEFELIIDFDFTTSPQQQVRFLSPYSLQLLSGDWGDLGFTIGASVTITGTITDIVGGGTRDYNAFAFTITDIIGDTIIVDTELYPPSLSFTGNISPNSGAGNDPLFFNLSTVAPETIEVYHNIVPNGSGFVSNSVIDGEVNRFKIEGVDALSVSAFATIQQLGNKSGGSYVSQTFQRISDVGTKRSYKVTLTYFTPTNFEDADFEKPSILDANQSLKPVYRILAYPEDNNPNSVLTYEYSANEGNVGWYNENYNQGINDFTIDSVVITGADGTILSEVDHNQTCNVELTVSNAAANFRDFTEVNFYLIPPTTEWKNNANSFVNNLRTSYFYKDDTAVTNLELTFPKNGQEVTTANQTINVSTANQIVISFDLIPNAAFTTYINSLASSERQYRISAYVESVGGTDNENNGVSLIIQEGLLTAQPIEDQPYTKVDSALFFNHAQDLGTGVGEVNYNGCTEDDFVFQSLFKLTKNVLWEQLSLSIEVVRDSDGAFFQLQNKVISFLNYITSPDGTININYSEQLNQYLDSTGRNILKVQNTGVEVGSDYEVKIVWSLVASWRYWIDQNNALSDFFDGSLPNNGRNSEWMRYLREAGYSIRLRARLLNNGVNYYWGGNINLQDYETNLLTPTINTTIQYFDESGTEQTALLPNQDMIVRAEHALLSGSWSVLDVWGWIAERGFENDPSKRISTAWNWTSQTSPLKPLIGETKAKLTFPSATVARVECRVDTSQLGDINNTFVARIESPIAPACVPFWPFLFDYIVANSDSESDYLPLLNNIVTTGIDVTGSNICCPTCTMNTIFGVPTEVYAFGNNTDIGNYIKEYSDTECCRDVYAGALGCEVGFDTSLDEFAALVGDASFLAETPNQINTYSGNNVGVLVAEIIALTTNNAIRSRIMNLLVSDGIAFTCDPATGTKIISGI